MPFSSAEVFTDIWLTHDPTRFAEMQRLLMDQQAAVLIAPGQSSIRWTMGTAWINDAVGGRIHGSRPIGSPAEEVKEYVHVDIPKALWGVNGNANTPPIKQALNGLLDSYPYLQRINLIKQQVEVTHQQGWQDQQQLAFVRLLTIEPEDPWLVAIAGSVYRNRLPEAVLEGIRVSSHYRAA